MTDRMIAIGTNENAIKKLAIQDGRHDLANDKQFIRGAANWSYRNFGFGTACYGSYLDYLKKHNKKRLYRSNNALWRKQRKQVFKRDNYTCAYCGQRGGILEMDHIKPISRGGTNSLDNLTTSCRLCNRRKKDKPVHEFLRENYD